MTALLAVILWATRADAQEAPAAPTAVPASPMAEADALWEQRLDGAKLEEALTKYQAIADADPTNRDALVKLTRGWYFFGDGFTDDTAVKLERWAKAVEAGKKCLAVNADFAKRIQEGAKERDAAAVATKDDVPCLYWESTALGKWAKAQGLATTLKHLPTVKAYMSKVEELDPTFFHYGPARYWGAYYAALPTFAGQDLEKSKEYLQASIDGEPNYLATRVIRAEYYAVTAQDSKLFTDDLNYVIAADPNALEGAVPENTKEQEKAKKLLARKDDLFLADDSGKKKKKDK